MARSARVVATARGGTQDLGGGRSMRILSGSMGAPDANLIDDAPFSANDTVFEAPVQSDDAWAAELRRREQAQGLPQTPMRPKLTIYPDAPYETIVQAPHIPPRAATQTPATADLTALPDRFTLEIEKKEGGWWKISAPAHHAGLFIAHQDLLMALADAPGALAQILRLDGAVPVPKKGRKPRGS